MTAHSVEERYFDWLCNVICYQSVDISDYEMMLRHLHHTAFSYTIERDGNRAEDGINLRYRFGREQSLPDAVIASCLDNKDCSIFEMMVALALRCDEHIMYDYTIGSRAGQWFWLMVDNLGLIGMDDANYNEVRVNKVLQRFLDRKYAPNGKGGLFIIDNCEYDLRTVEIWYQLNWYLKDYT